MEEKLRSKVLYKSLLGVLKIIPCLSALGCLTNTLLAYYNIDIPILSYLYGMSLLPWIFILLASYVFKFCSYHRMFLYYILMIDALDIIDYHYNIPLSNYRFFVLHIIITGFSLFLILYLYVKSSKKAA